MALNEAQLTLALGIISDELKMLEQEVNSVTNGVFYSDGWSAIGEKLEILKLLAKE